MFLLKLYPEAHYDMPYNFEALQETWFWFQYSFKTAIIKREKYFDLIL